VVVESGECMREEVIFIIVFLFGLHVSYIQMVRF
jgi:hypothetical protein